MAQRTRWNFHKVQQQMPHLQSREAQEYLMKWGLKDTLTFFTFVFDEPLKPYDIQNFLLSFVSTAEAQRCLGLRRFASKSLAPDEGISIEKLKTLPLSCSATDMTMFQRFERMGIVAESGTIKKCFPIPHPDFEVIDRVREALVCDDSELFEEFDGILSHSNPYSYFCFFP